jgi:hypothetical protein
VGGAHSRRVAVREGFWPFAFERSESAGRPIDDVPKPKADKVGRGGETAGGLFVMTWQKAKVI